MVSKKESHINYPNRIAARLGGEEMIVINLYCDNQNATISEAIRESVRLLKHQLESKKEQTQ